VKPATKAILMIVGVAILYIATLTLGLMREDSGDASSDPKEEPGIEMLGKLTMPFAPRYDTRYLRCHGRLLARGPKLSADQTDCNIEINPFYPEDEEYRVILLEVEPEPADPSFAAYVRAIYKEEDNPLAKRDPASCRLASEMGDDEFRLEIAYKEDTDPEDDEWLCWLKQEIRLPLRIALVREERQPLAPLPKLALRCIGCDTDPPRAITLRAEGKE
jgi:hypothetical protein